MLCLRREVVRFLIAEGAAATREIDECAICTLARFDYHQFLLAAASNIAFDHNKLRVF
jgi:hypothetical protein